MTIRSSLLAFLFLIAAFTVSVTAQEQAPKVPTMAPILERVLPGVVSIAVKGHVARVETPLLDASSARRRTSSRRSTSSRLPARA